MTRRKAPSVPFNFVMNLILKLSGTICTAISYPYAFRVIGETGMGRVAFATSLGSFFLILAGIGVSTYGIRECAKVREDPAALRRTARELVCLQLIMTLVSGALLFSAVRVLPRLREYRILFLIQGGLLLFHGLDTEWLFAAKERYGFLALRAFGVKALSVVLILLLVRSPGDELLYALILAGTAVLGNLLNLWGARDILMGPREELHPLRHIRASAVFFLQAVATTVYTSLDSALLGFLQDEAVVGAYDAAAKIRMVLVMLVTGLGAVLMPRFSYYVGEKQEEAFRRGLRLSGNFVLLSAVPLICFFLCLGESFLEFLYRSVLPDTLRSLVLLLPTLLLIGCSNLTGIQLLVPLGKERAVMLSTAAGAVVDLAADLLLIPSMGAAGAALGTLIAEAAVLGIQVLAARELGIRILDRKYAFMIPAVSLPAVLWLLLLRPLPLSPLLRIILGAVLYFGTVYGILLRLKEPVLGRIFLWLRSSLGSRGTRAE